MRIRPLTSTFILALTCAATLPAQDPAPLVRPDSGTNTRVTVRKKGRPTDTEKQPRATPEAPVDSSLLVVGIVNSHRLTRSQLQYYVDRRMELLGETELIGDDEAWQQVFAPDGTADTSYREDPEFRAEYLAQQEQTRRNLEGDALQSWVDARILADEARRQGLIVETREFEAELENIRTALGKTAEELGPFLENYTITLSQFESEVMDAILSRKLLERFIRQNFTDVELRQMFEERRMDYRHAERFRIAQYLIALDGSEDANLRSKSRSDARTVRDRMIKSTDLAFLSGLSNINMGEFATPDSGWMDAEINSIPPDVLDVVRKLKAGQVSEVIEERDPDIAGRPVRSYQVVKLLDRQAARALPFEEAMPILIRDLGEEGRGKLLTMIREARTHRIITNLRAIPGDLIPSREDMIRHETNARPIDLTIPDEAQARSSD